MDAYGTAQLPGDRYHQCDATAVWTAPGRARAYVLLDGVGDTPAVRAWTRTAARRLARTAALHANAGAGLRAERARYAAEPGRHPRDEPQLPCAAAVVVVHTPATPGVGAVLSFAWSGDARAYLLLDGHLRLITEDHNQRRAYDGHGDRNALTACLGAGWDDQETEERYGHPAVETVRGPARPGRLLLTSDGAYEPYGHDDRDLADHLTGAPRASARRLVDDAVRRARALPDPYADNATALIAHLT
ncbi:PP2C family protein-serine/threonine phosphatase [Streptomyces tsukubensis]|uniref:PP2C family protein-serine/threonine phosphatase n=1 Tax=Streptomyces tsukubensis TaxID=83656 RepID=UPI00344C1C9E